MEYKDIKKLMDDMGNSKIDSLDIEFPEGIKISMTKNSSKGVASQTNVMEVKDAPTTIEKNITKRESAEENYKIVKAPMVGTFYQSSSPDQEAFVKVGDTVHKGQVLCIVEAMKLMNEIESEFDGEIVEVCVKNEDIVEYGMPLFKIK